MKNTNLKLVQDTSVVAAQMRAMVAAYGQQNFGETWELRRMTPPGHTALYAIYQVADNGKAKKLINNEYAIIDVPLVLDGMTLAAAKFLG